MVTRPCLSGVSGWALARKTRTKSRTCARGARGRLHQVGDAVELGGREDVEAALLTGGDDQARRRARRGSAPGGTAAPCRRAGACGCPGTPPRAPPPRPFTTRPAAPDSSTLLHPAPPRRRFRDPFAACFSVFCQFSAGGAKWRRSRPHPHPARRASTQRRSGARNGPARRSGRAVRGRWSPGRRRVERGGASAGRPVGRGGGALHTVTTRHPNRRGPPLTRHPWGKIEGTARPDRSLGRTPTTKGRTVSDLENHRRAPPDTERAERRVAGAPRSTWCCRCRRRSPPR